MATSGNPLVKSLAVSTTGSPLPCFSFATPSSISTSSTSSSSSIARFGAGSNAPSVFSWAPASTAASASFNFSGCTTTFSSASTFSFGSTPLLTAGNFISTDSNAITSSSTAMGEEPLPGVGMYSSSWKNSDTVVVVEDEEFHCHSAILELHAPGLSEMMNDMVKEGNNNERRITLNDKEKSVFHFFLDCMYPIAKSTQIDVITHRKFLCQVLEYAQEYAADGVKYVLDQMLLQVVDGLIRSAENFEKCMQILSVADTYQLVETKKACCFFLSQIDRASEGSGYEFQKTCLSRLSSGCQFEILKIELSKLGLDTLPNGNNNKVGRDITLNATELQNFYSFLNH